MAICFEHDQFLFLYSLLGIFIISSTRDLKHHPKPGPFFRHRDTRREDELLQAASAAWTTGPIPVLHGARSWLGMGIIWNGQFHQDFMGIQPLNDGKNTI